MAKKKMNGIETEIFERQAVICKAFAHPIRTHLLDMLGKGECGFGYLQDAIGVSQD